MVRQLPVIRTMVMEIRGTSRAFLKPCRLTFSAFPNFPEWRGSCNRTRRDTAKVGPEGRRRRPGAGNASVIRCRTFVGQPKYLQLICPSSHNSGCCRSSDRALRRLSLKVLRHVRVPIEKRSGKSAEIILSHNAVDTKYLDSPPRFSALMHLFGPPPF